MGDTDSEPESKGTLRFALFVGLLIAVAVLVLTMVIESERDAPRYVDAAIAWIMLWMGLLFILLAPIVGVWMLRTKDLAWVVIPPTLLFCAGAALLRLGAWGPFAGLAVATLAAAAIVIWRPLDDASS